MSETKKCFIHKQTTVEPGDHDSIILYSPKPGEVTLMVDFHPTSETIFESVHIRFNSKQTLKLFTEFDQIMKKYLEE